LLCFIAGVNKLIFVGSDVVGKKVMAAAAETLTPVVLELGGKDAVIVCDDANVDNVSGTCLFLQLYLLYLNRLWHRMCDIGSQCATEESDACVGKQSCMHSYSLPTLGCLLSLALLCRWSRLHARLHT
jgi:hypothetical protein